MTLFPALCQCEQGARALLGEVHHGRIVQDRFQFRRNQSKVAGLAFGDLRLQLTKIGVETEALVLQVKCKPDA